MATWDDIMMETRSDGRAQAERDNLECPKGNTDCAYYDTNWGCKLLNPDYPGYGEPCKVTAYQGDMATEDDYRGMVNAE